MIRYLDLRSCDAKETEKSIEAKSTEAAYLTAWQLAAIKPAIWRLKSNSLLVTVPDFLNYARLLSTGQAKAVAELPGSISRSAIAGSRAGLGTVLQLPKLAKMDFWAIAEVLLRYDLALIPPDFSGAICLHSHLVDFACAFEREDFLQLFFSLARHQAGVHTQQLPMCLSCLSRWGLSPGILSFLCSTSDPDGSAVLKAANASRLFSSTRVIAELESWPQDLQRPQLAELACGIKLHGIQVHANLVTSA